MVGRTNLQPEHYRAIQETFEDTGLDWTATAMYLTSECCAEEAVSIYAVRYGLAMAAGKILEAYKQRVEESYYLISGCRSNMAAITLLINLRKMANEEEGHVSTF
ncbi:MAG: hypothetical protein WC686_04545 [Candidatus Shapirobacteria bacterium]